VCSSHIDDGACAHNCIRQTQTKRPLTRNGLRLEIIKNISFVTRLRQSGLVEVVEDRNMWQCFTEMVIDFTIS
jgi:hypothetical protein